MQVLGLTLDTGLDPCKEHFSDGPGSQGWSGLLSSEIVSHLSRNPVTISGARVLIMALTVQWKY